MSIIDFHNHLVPGVDDGAQTAEDAAAALRVMGAEGVRGVVVTPHVNAATAAIDAEREARLAEITAGWEVLQGLARQAGMEVWRGAEVALDIPRPDLGDPRLRLNGTQFVLVEFAYMTVPPASAGVLGQVSDAGWIPVLAHPERYRTFESPMRLAEEWRAAGALLQINGASLLGRYGDRPRDVAFELLARDCATFVCSDYHARGKPRIAQYRKVLEAEVGTEAAALLLETNPLRLVDGEVPMPVTGAGSRRAAWRSRWRRLWG